MALQKKTASTGTRTRWLRALGTTLDEADDSAAHVLDVAPRGFDGSLGRLNGDDFGAVVGDRGGEEAGDGASAGAQVDDMLTAAEAGERDEAAVNVLVEGMLGESVQSPLAIRARVRCFGGRHLPPSLSSITRSSIREATSYFVINGNSSVRHRRPGG